MKESRRSLLASVAVVISAAALVGCGADSHADSAALRSALATKCSAKTLRLSLQTQGTATQSVAFLKLIDKSRRLCLASGEAVFTVEQNGRPARVRNNPLSVPVRIRLLAKQSKTIFNDVWWSNWCGSRRNIDLAVRFDGSIVHSPFSVLPGCLDRKDPSRLTQGPAR
jgi:hypothetical protein